MASNNKAKLVSNQNLSRTFSWAYPQFHHERTAFDKIGKRMEKGLRHIPQGNSKQNVLEQPIALASSSKILEQIHQVIFILSPLSLLHQAISLIKKTNSNPPFSPFGLKPTNETTVLHTRACTINLLLLGKAAWTSPVGCTSPGPSSQRRLRKARTSEPLKPSK